jgi:autotransporter-associated beta strand protein
MNSFSKKKLPMLVLSLIPGAVSATVFLDFSNGLTGWTYSGTAMVLSGSDSTNFGSTTFTITPATSENMIKIMPQSSSVNNVSAAETAFGLSSGSLSTLLNTAGSSPTNFGYITKNFSALSAGTYSFSWGYAAEDYQPYNDGVMFAISGAGTEQILSLARNGSSSSDLSGPQSSTLVLGSYGATPWVTSSFTVASSGNYQITFADYNWSDTSLDPIFYVAANPGSTSGANPRFIPPISATNIINPAMLAAGLAANTLNPVFDGGTLKLDGTVLGSSYNFTVTNNNGSIDLNNNSATIATMIANASGANGSLTITNTGSGGALTFSGINTYTGTTTINSGATLALSGSGLIATSSGVVADGTLNVSDTNTGATITTLSGSGSVVTAANKGLTLSAAAGTFSGAISGAGGLTVATGTETLSGTNTYTGTTTINSGATLALSGSGSIATSSGVTNNGTLRVTAATGNVALGGTYTQSSGGSLLMNFSATNNQQINVSNTASLAGNLAITASAGTYNVGRYTLITASNGVSGTFNSFDGSSFSNLSADYSNYALGYDANNVYLNLYPTAANTQASIESNLASLRGAYNLANIAMNNNLNQDCSFFNEYGFCASLIGSHTTIAGSKDTDMSDGILVLAKKMGDHFRIGAYLDQTININNNSYVRLRNDGPGFGGFAVWNRQADGLGAQLRASAGHTSKDLSVTRQVVRNAEAGTGKTDFDSYGAAIVASYAVEATDNLNVTPYAGVRWTKVTADGYTEDSTAFAPLNFAALSQSATTLMGGLKVNKAINQQAAAYASFALEQDIHNNGGSYSANSANIAGITPVAFNQDINKVRPVVNAGTQYNIDRRQRIGADVIWSEQAFTKIDSTTLMVRYTLGL